MSSPKKTDLKCPVCEEVGKAFICVKCICSGDYTRSTMFGGHRCTANTAVAYDAKDAAIVKWTMKDRKNLSQLMEAEQTKINERFEELLAEYKKLEEIESYIAEYEFKISNIKNLIKLRKSEATLAQERSRSMVKNEEKLRTRIESCTDASKEISKKIDHSKSHVASNYAESNKIEAEIRKKNRENLLKLKEHLFPFERRNEQSESCTTETFSNHNTQTGASVDSETDLINARSSGSWSRQNPHQYCIVESWIPEDAGTFEYSEFASLCKQREKLNQDFNLHLHDDYSTRDNPAYRISSALANISQLISVASSILDIRLPKKQKFFDWYPTYDAAGFEVFPTDSEIFHKAANLNANLMYLCLSQNVQTELLNPTMTGNNLSLIFDPDNSNLGRTGPISIPQDLHRVIEETLLPDFNLFDTKDYEDFEFFDEELSDWENVSRSSVIDISHDNQTASTCESMLTNLAETCYNAVTSFIRR